ncbi:MAG: pantoate--beta-alanine ligase [Gammaproteobacteria bacterium]|jgi:pantoate--beta-alanine ligase
MIAITSSQQLRGQLQTWRQERQSIALVPTMGNLHAGHLQLVEKAQQQADKIVVSIFVNPLQFAPGSDFESYPRTLQQDSEKLERLNVGLVFCPDVSVIYPQGMELSTKVIVPGLSEILCGKYRPGHFEGVTTIVSKLLNLVQPDVAVFGEKDYQQLVIIRRMVEDLCVPVKVVGVETVREKNGLAMSSRNQYLSQQELEIAALLNSTLVSVVKQVKERDNNTEAATADFQQIEQKAMQALEANGFRPEYIKICHADDLSDAKPDSGKSRGMRVLGAAWLGKARLIDNLPVE